MTDRAQSLGFYSSMNQLEVCQNYEQTIESVRLEDIIRVIEKYMSEEPNRIQMLPEGSSEPVKVDSSPTSSELKYEVETLKPSLHHIKFSSGLQAYYQQNELESTSSCYVYVKNFSELTSRFPAGTGSLLQRLISRGSVSLSQEQITHTLDGIGARYGTICSDSRTRRENYCNFLQCPSESFEQAMGVFGKFFSEATFPQIEWDKCLSLTRMEIRAKKDSLSSYCMDHLLQNYFGDHPYASAFTGDLESIEKIKEKMLKNYMRFSTHREISSLVYPVLVRLMILYPSSTVI